MGWHRPDSTGSWQGQIAGFCKQGQETLGSIKCGELLDYLRNYQLPKTDSPQRSYRKIIYVLCPLHELHIRHRIHQDRQCTFNVPPGALALKLLLWKDNNAFPLYCCWPAGSCEQCKTVESCHGNARMGRSLRCCRGTDHLPLLSTAQTYSGLRV